MTKRLRFTIYMCIFLFTVSQEGAAQFWMQKAGGLTVDEGADICVDNSGNTYSTGYFTGSASFGSTTLSSSGSTDIFVVKTNNQGQYQWAVKAGGSGADKGLSIKCDGSGNVYVTGFFNGTASFGSSSLTSAGLQDAFVAMYNTSGTLQWVVQAGGSSADIGSGISVDNSGNAIVTGEFKDTASFGSSTLVSTSGTVDAFLTKISSSGTFVWSKKGAGTNTIRGLDVACDGSGNIYAMGQFSGNLTWDVTHNNTMFNVGYVTKFNSSGAEQWFRVIGGGTSVSVNSIACDGSGNSYVTGDFTGTLTFFGSTNTTLTNGFSERIFVARYTNAGVLSWASSSGSDSPISSRSVAVDASGNAAIAGYFECRLDEYSDEYGEANFMSVGDNDIFVASFNGSGVWQYARNFGGRDDDKAFGVACNSAGQIHFTGSFNAAIYIPVSSNFVSSNLSLWSDVSCTGNSPYCGDSDYGSYRRMTPAGNADIIIANCVDPDREPFDFYKRSGSACDRDVLSVCIEPNCPDTVIGCSLVSVQAIPPICSGVAPNFNYIWSSFGGSGQTTTFNTSGSKTVTMTSEDGCFSTTDTIEVVIYTVPKPTISDDVVINTNAINPLAINLCGPDTVLLTGGNYGSNAINWSGPGMGAGDTLDTVSVTVSGVYNFISTDSTGCQNITSILVNIFEPLDSFLLKMNIQDTYSICNGVPFQIWVYDSIANPNGTPQCLINNPYTVITTWSVTPSLPATEGCETTLDIWTSDTGMIYITTQVVRLTPCDTDTSVVTDSTYVQVLPTPEITPFTLTLSDSRYYCPGDTTMLVVSGGPNYEWTGTGNYGNTNDTIYAWAEDFYSVSSTVYDTNQFGCTDEFTASITRCITEKPQPEINASNLLICPSDSVLLTAYHPNTGEICYYTLTGSSGSFYWEGPSGPLASTSSSVYVTEPGQYFCVFNDGDSCGLVSNTVELTQYTTPQLLANGDLVICDGDSVQLSVIANEQSLIEWLPPLSGSGTTKTVYEPGVYTCRITVCNIETYATMEVFASYVEAEITPTRPLCLNDTIILYGSDSMETYQWLPGNQTSDSILVTQPGSYVLQTTDSNGCAKTSDTVHIFITQQPTAVSIDTIPVFCEGDSVVMYGNDSMSHYLWLPTGDTTRFITVFEEGSYSLFTVDSNGCRGRDTLEVITPRTDSPVQITGDTAFCEGDSVVFFASRGRLAAYDWNGTVQTGRTIVVYESGTYQLVSTDTFGCLSYSAPISVYVEPNTIIKPSGRDTTICAGTFAVLDAATNIGNIEWYATDDFDDDPIESGDQYITPLLYDSATYYLVSYHSLCASDSGSIRVHVIDCDNIFVPNFLTPNGDGVNDIFRIYLNEATCFHCRIYNRWGMLMYQWDQITAGWDGSITNSNQKALDGTYYYLVEYCRHDGSTGTVQGSLTLIRH